VGTPTNKIAVHIGGSARVLLGSSLSLRAMPCARWLDADAEPPAQARA